MARIITVILCLLLTGCQRQETQVSTSEDNFTYQEIEKYFKEFQTGDLMNIENSHYISNLAIPGRWKHTLIYLGTEAQVQKMISKESRYYQKIMEMYLDKDEVVVLDANVGGVQLRYFKQMANLKDESYLKSMVCYRFVKEKEFINQFIENALSYLHTPYDYEMDSTNDQKLYCSELVVWSLKKMNIEFSQNTKLFQYTIISPTDLITDLKRQKMIKKVLILEQ